MHKRPLLWFFFYLLSVTTYGQIYKYVETDDGLSARQVYDIQQSNYGFMWLLTHNGIDRYDGTFIVPYKLSLPNRSYIDYSTCRLLYIPSDDNLWVTSNQGHIIRFSNVDDMFEPMYSFGNDSLINNNHCSYSFVDKDENIWMFMQDSIYRYNTHTQQITTVYSNYSLTRVTSVANGENGSYYIGTSEGVVHACLHKDTLWVTAIKQLTFDKATTNTLFYSRLFHKLIAGTEDKGVIVYDTKEDTIIYQSPLHGVRISTIIPYMNENEILIATNAIGIYKMNLLDCVPRPFLQADYVYDYRMNSDNISDLYLDEDHQLWIGSYPKGVTIFNISYPQFGWTKRSIKNSNSLVNNDVNNIIEDSDHDLWYATNNGVSLYNKQTQQWHQLLSTKRDDSPNPNHYFLSLCELRPGIILAGGYASGIYIIDKKNITYRFRDFQKKFSDKYIRALYKDQTKPYLWIGGENRLLRYNYKTDEAVPFNEIKNITYIIPKAWGHLWIGTKNGLFAFNKQHGTFNKINLPIGDFHVNMLLQDKNNNLYIATGNQGLLVYNEFENFFRQYNVNNSTLVSNSIQAIIESDHNMLFISTEKGLTKFNSTAGSFTNWTKDQGLESVNFNCASACHTYNGKLLFGSDNGIIEVNENCTLPHIYKSKIVLTNLYIQNEQYSPTQNDSPLRIHVNRTDKLSLSYQQRHFTISVRNVNYIYPSDCKLCWSLNKKDETQKWTELPANGMLNVSGSYPGIFNLIIRSYSSETSKVLDERQLTVQILPPFQLSPLGFVLFISFTFFITLIIFRYLRTVGSVRLSNDKIHFFLNTSHDIRTPLTLILGPLEELKENPNLSSRERELIETAKTNATVLQKLTDNAIQYERGKNNHRKLKLSEIEIYAYLQRHIDSLSYMFSSKNLKVEFSHQDSPLMVWVDLHQMDSIVLNILSNAIKYTPIRGSIHVFVKHTDTHWSIIVSDTGIGIDQAEQKKLFKELFRGSNAINAKITGAGIGLLTINQYIKQHKGKISIQSKEGEGTSFCLQFMLGHNHFSKKEAEIVQSPCDIREPEYPIEEEEDDETDSRVRLLIVEDNLDLLDYLSKYFNKHFNVFMATNGKEALEKTKYVMPDIILSDVMMPYIQGDELCKIIKSDLHTSHISVILISALNDQTSVLKGLSYHADAYITKPFDVKILETTLLNIAKNRSILKQRFSVFNLEEDKLTTNSELDLRFMKEVKDAIEKNIDDTSFTVDTLCAILHQSRSTLYGKIKALTGHSPSNFVRLCRINKAQVLLKSNQYTIAEVADLVGFSDIKYFRELFKKMVGKTPSEFKNNE